MKLLMISGDRSILSGKRGAFWYTLQELRTHFDRIDIICPHVSRVLPLPPDANTKPSQGGRCTSIPVRTDSGISRGGS